MWSKMNHARMKYTAQDSSQKRGFTYPGEVKQEVKQEYGNLGLVEGAKCVVDCKLRVSFIVATELLIVGLQDCLFGLTVLLSTQTQMCSCKKNAGVKSFLGRLLCWHLLIYEIFL